MHNNPGTQRDGFNAIEAADRAIMDEAHEALPQWARERLQAMPFYTDPRDLYLIWDRYGEATLKKAIDFGEALQGWQWERDNRKALGIPFDVPEPTFHDFPPPGPRGRWRP